MIIFLEDSDGLLVCKSKDYNRWTILASIARYKYFYGKVISIGNQEELFKGFSLKSYDKHRDEIKIRSVEVYTKVKIKVDDCLLAKPQKEKKVDRLNGQVLLDLFLKLYNEEYGIVYVINNENTYKNKFRKLMDNFYMSGLSDAHIRGFIKRAVQFGNHNGDPIYIDWLFDDKVLSNYLLVVKGLKDITSVWQYLDVSLSNIERKKIRYLMNVKRFNDLEDTEKDITIKLYKRYDRKIYEQLISQYKPKNNFIAKVRLFELLAVEYGTSVDVLLKQTKHSKKYFFYDYTKAQIKEAMYEG